MWAESVTFYSIDLAWDEPANSGPDVHDYDFQYKRAYQVNWSNVTYESSLRSYLFDRNIWPDAEYNFRVRAVNAEGVGEWGDPISVTSNKIPRVAATVETAPSLMSTHNYRTCAVNESGITCWGAGPTWSTQHSGLYMTVSSADDHGCGLFSDGHVGCWGRTSGAITPPDGPFISITAEDSGEVGPEGEYTCGIRPDDTVECWGATTNEAHLPPPDTRFTEIDAAEFFACGVKINHELVCWGSDSRWRLDVPDGRYDSVSAGLTNSCAVSESGVLACWGERYNDLNNAPSGYYHSVSVGSFHACAVATDLSVVCWGSNDYGQSDVPEGTTAIAVAAGYRHTCAVTPEGGVVCWGDNENAQTDVPEGLVVDMPGPEVVNLPPYVSKGNFAVYEGATFVGYVYVTELDVIDTYLKTTLGGPDGSLFTYGEGGDLYFISPADSGNPSDANGDNVYEIRITVTTGEGRRELTAYRDLMVAVLPRSE